MLDAQCIRTPSLPNDMLSTDEWVGCDSFSEEVLMNPGCVIATLIDWFKTIRPLHQSMG